MTFNHLAVAEDLGLLLNYKGLVRTIKLYSSVHKTQVIGTLLLNNFLTLDPVSIMPECFGLTFYSTLYPIAKQEIIYLKVSLESKSLLVPFEEEADICCRPAHNTAVAAAFLALSSFADDDSAETSALPLADFSSIPSLGRHTSRMADDGE